MIISVWMVGILWVILSICVFIKISNFDKDIKTGPWYLKITVFLFSMLIVLFSALFLYAIGYILFRLINMLWDIDWKVFLNREVIYIH